MTLPRLLATVAVLALSGALHAEVVVIVHRSNPVGTMTADQVAQIYMGASTTFPGGGAAVPIDQPEGSTVRDEFLAKVLEKTGAQFKAVWSRLIFSGKGTRPKTLGSSADVKKAVGSDPGAIGFIERSALDDSVRPVLGVK